MPRTRQALRTQKHAPATKKSCIYNRSNIIFIIFHHGVENHCPNLEALAAKEEKELFSKVKTKYYDYPVQSNALALQTYFKYQVLHESLAPAKRVSF